MRCFQRGLARLARFVGGLFNPAHEYTCNYEHASDKGNPTPPAIMTTSIWMKAKTHSAILRLSTCKRNGPLVLDLAGGNG